MFFKRFYDDNLAQASYMSACGEDALVADLAKIGLNRVAPDEWSHGHLPGAIHIPLAALPDRVSELDPSVPIVLQCKGGGRSSLATSFLQANGIGNVSNLAGGYEGWVAERFEVER